MVDGGSPSSMDARGLGSGGHVFRARGDGFWAEGASASRQQPRAAGLRCAFRRARHWWTGPPPPSGGGLCVAIDRAAIHGREYLLDAELTIRPAAKCEE